MVLALVVILIVLWLLGYISIPGILIPNITLFSVNGYPVTLWNVLIFMVVAWLIGILPRPFREIAGVILLLWILSLFGILGIPHISSVLVIAIIIGALISLFA